MAVSVAMNLASEAPESTAKRVRASFCLASMKNTLTAMVSATKVPIMSAERTRMGM